MKKKLFLCFRPVSVKIETESIGPDSFDDQIISSSTPTTPANIRSPKTSFLKNSPASTVKNSRISESEIPKKKKARRSKSFPTFALFEISSKKKARDKKDIQVAEDSRIIKDSTKSDPLFLDKTKSSPPTLPSALPPKPNHPSEENKDFPSEPITPAIQKKHIIHQGHKKTEKPRLINGLRNSQEGMFFILINLVITVFYGRLCAILFTCLFLYSVCRVRNSSKQVVEPVANVATVERDYRKKVIMEGLLQRDSRQQQQRRGH